MWINNLLLSITFTLVISVHSNELSKLNDQFLATYDRARNHLISTINPLIICNGNDAILIHRGKRFEEQVIPEVYHDLKAISHIPFKIYLTVMFNIGNLSQDNQIELEQYLEKIRSLRKSIQFPTNMQANQYDIIDLSTAYIQTLLETKIVDKIQLEEFCQRARRLFSFNIELAARSHVDMLDSVIRPWYYERFNKTERNTLKVVIMGPKTARYGYLEKKYFYGLLEDRHEGKHIIYVEHTDSEEKALEILGIWLLDAKASRSFFDGDSERLHQDLLADASDVYIKRLFKTSKKEL